MNRNELITAVAAHADIPKVKAAAVLDALTSTITDQLRAGNEISLVGFGSFSVKKRPERTGRNPQTGQPMTIAASAAPTFRPGKSLKDALN